MWKGLLNAWISLQIIKLKGAAINKIKQIKNKVINKIGISVIYERKPFQEGQSNITRVPSTLYVLATYWQELVWVTCLLWL